MKKYKDSYRLKQQIVEPVLGVMKPQWHFGHVLLKGHKYVETEVTLAALTWNNLRLLTLKGIKWIEYALNKAFLGKKNIVVFQKTSQRLNLIMKERLICTIRLLPCAA